MSVNLHIEMWVQKLGHQVKSKGNLLRSRGHSFSSISQKPNQNVCLSISKMVHVGLPWSNEKNVFEIESRSSLQFQLYFSETQHVCLHVRQSQVTRANERKLVNTLEVKVVAQTILHKNSKLSSPCCRAIISLLCAANIHKYIYRPLCMVIKAL